MATCTNLSQELNLPKHLRLTAYPLRRRQPKRSFRYYVVARTSGTDIKRRGDIDPALVRHVYDVARIAEKAEASLITAKSIFPQHVLNDREEFKRQNPQFDADPVEVLKRTLLAAKKNGELKERYNTILLPLVYDLDPPSFEKAFASFENVADELISAC